MVPGDEVAGLVRRMRRRQGLSRSRLSDRVVRVSGDHTMNPERLRRWEVGKEVPDGYWRGWLAAALGVPRDGLDRAAAVTRGRRAAAGRAGRQAH